MMSLPKNATAVMPTWTRGRAAVLFLVFCAGSVGALAVAYWAWTVREQAFHAEFEVRVARQSILIREYLNEVTNEIDSIVRYYHVSPHVSRKQFRDYTTPIVQRNESIQALEWIPRVTTAERLSFEQDAGMDGLEGFRITEHDSAGDMISAGVREEYFPVYFVEPMAGNEQALGFDLGSNSIRRASLNAARDLGVPQATAPLVLVQETESQKGVLIFFPIYRDGSVPPTQDERREKLRGFALGVLRAGELIERNLRQVRAQGVDIWWLDRQAPPDARILHFHSSAGRLAGIAPPDEQQARAGLHREVVMPLGGRDWSLLMVPAPGLAEQVRGVPPWLVFSIIWSITIAMTLYLRQIWQVNTALQIEMERRLKIEERINVVNRLYRTLSEANQAIVHFHAREPMLAEICRIVVAQGGMRLSLVGLLDGKDGGLRFVAAAGDTKDFTQQLSLGAPAARPLEEALKAGSSMVLNAIAHDTAAVPWQGQALALGLRSMAVFPLTNEEGVAGVFVLYAAEENFFDTEIIKLLTELAGDISFALVSLEREQARRHAADALRASEREYRTLIDNLPDITWHKDADGAYISCNRSYAAALGIEPHAIVGRRDEDFYPPELADKYSADDRQVLDTGREFSTEESWSKDGETVWVSTRKVPVFDDSGRPVGTIGIARDITERRRMEIEIRQNNQELDIVNRIIALFLTVSDEEMYHEVLKAVLDTMESEYGVFGYLDADGALVVPSMSQHIWDKCQVADKRVVFPRTSWGNSSWPTAIREKRAICSNEPSSDIPPGHVAIVRHISLPIMYQQQVIGLFQVANKKSDYTASDVSRLETIANHVAPILSARLQRDVANMELQKHREHLEELVEARTAELAQKNSALEAANSDLESFSYSVSHDLRAPLRAIDGFTAILLEEYTEQLDDEGRRLFGVVGENARKMGRLIDDILAFSRAGRHELQVAPVDMMELTREAWKSLESQRGGRDIDFAVGQLPHACGDPGALRQVLQNLLSNAVKFTAGRERAVIDVAGHVEGDESVYCVRDNGVGFDMIYAPKLFGLFQRLHGMDEYEGTGVGLAIVRRFVTKHGGRAWAEGDVGKGASFWFSLPGHASCG